MDFLPGKNFEEVVNRMNGVLLDKTVLFVDLWGHTAKIQKLRETAHPMDQLVLVAEQERFMGGLLAFADRYPDIEVIQASDCAFAFSDSPEAVVAAAVFLFKRMNFHTHFSPCPVRGAISRGVIQVGQFLQRLPHVPNFHCIPYIGEGMAKASIIEGTGPEGMCLFVTSSVADVLPAQYRPFISSNSVGEVRLLKSDQKPELYYEFNWLAPRKYLTENIYAGRSLEQHYRAFALRWASEGGYHESVGNSVLRHLEWAMQI